MFSIYAVKASVADISDYILIPRQTLTRVIASLSEQNYIYSEKNSKDGRSFVLFLTDQGINYIKSLLEKYTSLWESINDHISRSELEAFHSCYSKMLDILADSAFKDR
ncbi:MAG: MarR family transcriptional regulator [Eubacterium sp.]|nr:MarR family transcriptional regulator [Eubacterium sp.]